MTRLIVLLGMLVSMWMPVAGVEDVIIPLWPEGVPDAQPSAAPEYEQDERIFNVQVPTLTRYPAAADKANGTAVIICPGGAYARLAFHKEGVKTALWLNSLGVEVFILKYRLKEYGHPAPLRDVLRAVRLVRSRAGEFGVDPARLGVMGFSAGGHLASSAATLFDHVDGRTGAPLDTVSARPDFAALIYPVILMEGPSIHTGSRDNLIGKSPTAERIALLSTERQVTPAMPPVFLVHTQEDATVPIENSLTFQAALRRAGVPVEAHYWEKGPHGFGLRDDLGPASGWPLRCEEWMRSHGWLSLR